MTRDIVVKEADRYPGEACPPEKPDPPTWMSIGEDARYFAFRVGRFRPGDDITSTHTIDEVDVPLCSLPHGSMHLRRHPHVLVMQATYHRD